MTLREARVRVLHPTETDGVDAWAEDAGLGVHDTVATPEP